MMHPGEPDADKMQEVRRATLQNKGAVTLGGLLHFRLGDYFGVCEIEWGVIDKNG